MTVHYCKNFTFKWKKRDGVGRGLKIILKRSFVKFKRFFTWWGRADRESFDATCRQNKVLLYLYIILCCKIKKSIQ